jgi:hypothetical protein
MSLRRLAALVVLSGSLLVGAGTAAAHPTRQSADTCKVGYYLNVSRHCIRRPGKSPVGATAKCRDGTYSYSEHASGTCSGHGGVAIWIHHP